LFAAQPDCQGVWESAWEGASFALSSSNPLRWFFLSLAVSVVAAVVSSLAFWFGEKRRPVYLLVAIHAFFGFFTYELLLVMTIAMPLSVAFYDYRSMHGQSLKSGGAP
jgi:hypothetical protein